MSTIPMRWAIVRHESCEDSVPHHKFLHQATKPQTSIPACYADLTSFRARNQPEFGPSFAVKIFCQDPFVDAEMGRKSSHSCRTQSTPIVDEVQQSEMENFVKEPIGYIWVVYEPAKCEEDTQHKVIKEESKKIFNDYYECVLDFRANSEFDKFDISRDWECYIEAVRTDWL